MRRVIVFFLMLAAAVSLSGCYTLKGAAEGLKGTAEGITKDVRAAWNSVNKADAWLQQKAW
mgnify:CR=1